MSQPSDRAQFAGLMARLRDTVTRNGDAHVGAAIDECIGLVAGGDARCPVARFFEAGGEPRERQWPAPNNTPRGVPMSAQAPGKFDSQKAVEFVHKALRDRALTLGKSKYLAALRECRWARGTSEACPLYRVCGPSADNGKG
jgi:hypothetical protein